MCITVIFNLTDVNIRAPIISKTGKTAVLPKSYEKQQSGDSSPMLALRYCAFNIHGGVVKIS